MDIDAAIGAQLERQRSARGWSLEKLSELAGVKDTDLAAWERGSQRVRAANLYRVITALGCRAGDIYRPISAIIDGERQFAKMLGAQHRDL